MQLKQDLVTVYVLWFRDLKRFLRERSRIVGMIGQPLLYLLIMGNGLGAAFRLAAAPPGFDYVTFMYPGILGMSVLFTSLFAAVSIIWDRQFGFLKEILVAPVSRTAVVIGKALGGSTVALIQAAILLAIAPLVGVPLTAGMVLKLLGAMFLIAFAITGLGMAVAARMETMEGFQMLMNFLVMPMFLLSGAFFPLRGVPGWMEALMRVNPLTYGVDVLRNILYADFPGRELLVSYTLGHNLAVVAGFGLLTLTAAVAQFVRRT